MKFTIENNKYNLLSLIRKIGYHPNKNHSFSKRLGRGEFPRFHIYVKLLENIFEFSLHLDQKGVCYKDQTAHNGDYEGDILQDEKKRIINLLKD